MSTTADQGNYAAAGEQRERLAKLCGRAEVIARDLSDAAVGDKVQRLAEQVLNEIFQVMVVGDFNRGKSTLVNALLGAPILPVKAIPATAVITEIRSGQDQLARLWRAGSTEPEIVDPADLVQLITIDNARRDTRSPYERAEVTWPVTVMPRDVVLVDSPGLNDDEGRDEITLNYLSNADAVIFLQHAIAAMSLGESRFLINYLDPHDPFFVFTYYDAVDSNDRNDVCVNARNRIAEVRGADRDGDRIFFVDAKAALQARMTDDIASFESSGVAELEHRLEDYLATERHKVKVMAPARSLRGCVIELIKAAPRQIALLDLDAAELARRWEKAQVPLQTLEKEAERIGADLANQARNLEQKVETLLVGFLETIADEAHRIAAGTTTETKLSLAFWQVKERAEQVAKEIAGATAAEIEQRLTHWVTKTLEPVIHTDLDEILTRLDTQITQFDADLTVLRVNLTGVNDAAAAGQDLEEKPMSRLLAGAGGFLLGGIAGGLVGGRLGAKEALRTLLPTVLIYLAWMVTPWGAASLLVALLLQGLWSANRGLGRLQSRMQETVGTELGKQIRLKAPAMANEATAKFIGGIMTPIQTAVTDDLAGRLAELRREVESTQEAHEEGTDRVDRRRAQLLRIETELGEVHQDVSDLIDDIGTL